MAVSYSFDERMVMSDGAHSLASVQSILMAQIPGAVSVERASKSDDRNGTDYWVRLGNGKAVSVDAKVRGTDPVVTFGKDDLALETWSVVESSKVGWTRDRNKHTDYVLWLWTPTGRWCLLPFPMLCAVFSDKWQEWRGKYRHEPQHTKEGDYHSECVFVPRREVWAEIYRRFSGAVALR